ncbi:hypothetical protein [Sphaerospermopsis aphanizomenoides]|uniref:hypothetical protein n=1 Tax=Sphaerospermopsis aphanizomenoides TaxID=459663 RepID=UPI001F2846A1|nr:hypothetical protein [Sphaerospermopsis aphanizomenoides]
MMNAQTKQMERERLLKVAQEYRQKGYEVILSPKLEELPDFLRDYRYLPDMIVRRGEDAAVIEVKSRRSLMSSAHNFKNLAALVNAHPGWRLELLMTNPDDELYSSKIENSLQAEEIKSRLQIAKQLTSNHPESAILYIWSLAEATLRLLAENEGLMLQKIESPLHLLKQLVTEGIISQTDYQLLMNNFQLRNAIAHGFKTTPVTLNSVLELIEVTEQLLDSLNVDSLA